MKIKSLLTFLICAAPLYSAVYNIRLSNAERYTDCSIIFKSASDTKFRGKDSNGNQVEKMVPSSSILSMIEVEEEKPEPKAEEQPAAAEEPKAEETKEAAEGEAAAPAKAEETIGELKEEAPIADGNLKMAEDIHKAKDETLRLRRKLEQINTQMATLSKPSSALQNMSRNTQQRVTRSLADMDKLVQEINELQQQFNQTGSGDFTFDIVPVSDRTKYEQDGKAAYKAMIDDMKQKKRSRKVGGLDKFEIMEDRYQGMPEFPAARESYLKTVRVLEKQWNKLKKAEEGKRRSMAPAKKSSMLAADQEELDKLEAYFKKQGEQIAQVWYNPSKRNLKMLQDCVNKAEDVLRRSEKTRLDDHVGKVPDLLKEFWSMMDDVRQKMITGDLEGADKTLSEDKTYREIVQLRSNLLPHEYSTPIKEQHKAVQTEIKKRMRDFRTIKITLERKTSQLDRSIASAESQIDNVLSTITQEKDMENPDEEASSAK